MSRRTLLLRSVAAAIALFVQALLPVAVIAAVSTGEWATICSADNGRPIALGGAPQPDALSHCPACPLCPDAGTTAGTPSAEEAAGFKPPDRACGVARPEAPDPVRLLARGSRPVQPRAPPAVS